MSDTESDIDFLQDISTMITNAPTGVRQRLETGSTTLSAYDELMGCGSAFKVSSTYAIQRVHNGSAVSARPAFAESGLVLVVAAVIGASRAYPPPACSGTPLFQHIRWRLIEHHSKRGGGGTMKCQIAIR